MSTQMAVLTGAGVFLLMMVLWLAIFHHGFVRLKNGTEEAYAAAEIFLKKRQNLIPNLVRAVKKQNAYDEDVLEEIAQAQSLISKAKGTEEKVAGENKLHNALENLFYTAEDCAEMRNSQSFISLQRQLVKIEDNIAAAGKFYNTFVTMYNKRVSVFPGSLAARLFRFRRKSMLEVGKSLMGTGR